MSGKQCLAVCGVVAWLLAVGGAASAGAAERIGPQGVFALPRAAWSACLDRSADDATGCLAQVMRVSGASAQALEINRLLNGEAYMEDFQERGRVDTATMIFPLRANTNAVPYLVNGSPLLVSTEIDTRALPLDADPQFAALKKASPEATLWTAAQELRSIAVLPGGGQGFVFAYPILDGCHACAVLGHALVSLDFGPDGRSLGPRLLGVEAAK